MNSRRMLTRCRCNVVIVFVAILSILPVLLLLKKASQRSSGSPFDVRLLSNTPNSSFTSILSRHASPSGFIVLALVDSGFVDMAINLYVSSLKSFDIENFLFVGAGRKACQALDELGIQCFVYIEDKDSEVASEYNTDAFNRKMNIRTDMILDALHAGFSVLHTDLDVFFLTNPLPELETILEKVDVAVMWDSSAYNAGFVAVKPSKFGIQVYEKVKNITDKTLKIDDQKALNRVIRGMLPKNKTGVQGLSVHVLDKKRYLCGKTYFEDGKRFVHGKDCPGCVVVHNNWIVSSEAKVYRFREHGMWMYDKDSYYTSQDNLYLSYDNPLLWNEESVSVEQELNALKAALVIGQITDRIVVLPKFHCTEGMLYYNLRNNKDKRSGKPTHDCPLNALIDIKSFDAAFNDKYRESSFFDNPLIKDLRYLDGATPVIINTALNEQVMNRVVKEMYNSSEKRVSVLTESEREAKFVLTDTEIWEIFNNRSVDPLVLTFAALYETLPLLSDARNVEALNHSLVEGFKRNDYRQYKSWR